jgi:putative NADPH-quinone reductase
LHKRNEDFGKEGREKNTNKRHEVNGKASYTMGHKPRIDEIDYRIQHIPQEIPNQVQDNGFNKIPYNHLF